MNNINLSIIIPHYNIPFLLEKLLLSIPKRPDIQVIVVDDNSTKNLNDYQCLRNKFENYVEFYSNYTGIQSAGACRNIGIEHAVGKWLLFPDSDDHYCTEMYSKLSRFFDSDYDMVFFNLTSQYADSNVVGTRHVKRSRRIMNYVNNPTQENLLNLGRVTEMWGYMVRNSVIHNNRIFCSQTLHCNDIMFQRKAFYYCKRITAIDDVIYCVIQREGSLTKTKSTGRFVDMVKEVTNAYIFDLQHYSRKEIAYIDMIPGSKVILDGIKYGVSLKSLVWALGYFVKYHVPLLPPRMHVLSRLIG